MAELTQNRDGDNAQSTKSLQNKKHKNLGTRKPSR